MRKTIPDWYDSVYNKTRIILFEYDENDRIKKQENWDLWKDQKVKHSTINFFYSSGELDSTINIIETTGHKKKTYYDGLGLKNKTVYNDSISLVYKYTNW